MSNESVRLRIKQARIDLLKEENAGLRSRVLRLEAFVGILKSRLGEQDALVTVGEEEGRGAEAADGDGDRQGAGSEVTSPTLEEASRA